MIGLLRYNLRLDPEDGGLIGSGSGLSLTELVAKVHSKQICQIETLVLQEQKTWLEIILNQLEKFKVQDENLIETIKNISIEEYEASGLTKVLAQRVRANKLRIDISSPGKSYLKRLN